MCENDLLKYRRRRKFPKLKLIEQVFMRESAIRKAIWEKRNDKAISGESIGGGGGKISSPTEKEAIQNLTPIKRVTLSDGFFLNHPELWIQVIDKTYSFFDDESRKIFKMAASGMHYQKVCMKMCITHTTFYNTLRDGQNYAIAVACQLGLIDIINNNRKENRATD